MTNEATREPYGSPGSPAPPIGEAAAFVAGLFSGCDQQVAVCEGTPPSMDPVQLATADSDSIPTACAPAALLPDHDERAECAVPRQPSTRALLRYSNITVALIVFVLAVLTFGSGLAVGYGVLGRRRKDGRKLTVQESNPLAARDTPPSKQVDDQASASNALDAPSVNPTMNLSGSKAPALTQENAGALPEGGGANANALQKPTAQPQSARTERANTTTEPPRVPTYSSALNDSLASTKPSPVQRAATAAQPVSMPLSRPPSSDGTVQTVGTSTQPVHSEKAPMDSVHAESVFPATDASDVPRTTTSPGLAAAATEGHVLPDGLPQEQSRPIAASAGQIDPCQLIHSVQPVYPREARRLHVEGDVELRVVVGVDGMVTSVGLVSGPPLLVPAAMAAARGFRYKSASLNGQPIETVQTIDMSFKLKN